MKKKIFITGGGGMLASAIEEFYHKNGDDVCAPAHQELDILDFDKVKDALESYKPYYVFHAAALHVDDCQDNQKLAYEVNSLATENIAKLCQEIKTTLIYISSCGYFGDEIKYYSEKDQVVLKTIYARTKYEGEILALQGCQKTYAIRPGWLFGGAENHKKNWVYLRFKEAKDAKIVKSANDKYGCPTFVNDLTLKIDEILNTKTPGVYHVTNSGGCNRYEYVKKIVESCGLTTEVMPVSSVNFPRKANIPNCELLENNNLKQLDLKLLPPWEDAIERYTKTMLIEIAL